MTRLEAIVTNADMTIGKPVVRSWMTDRDVHQRARQVADALEVSMSSVIGALVQEWLRQGADVSILVGQMGNNSNDQVGVNLTMPQKIHDKIREIRDSTPGFTMQGLANVLLSAWADAHGTAIEGQPVKVAHRPVSGNAKAQIACRISKTVLVKAQEMAKKQGIPMSQLGAKLLSVWIANGENDEVVRKRPIAEKRQSKPLNIYAPSDICKKARKIAASSRDFTLGDLMTSLLERWCEDNE